MNKKLPSYEELFENLDYYSADEARSVLSPAAYLADIMNLKDWNYDGDDAVDDRRDDISDIPLNAENTFTEIPHLDVANNVMERKVKAIEHGADPYTALKSAKFPMNVPFNLYKTEINGMLPYFKTDPAAFYGMFKAATDPAVSARETLGLSEEEAAVITIAVTDETVLKKYYGLGDSESLQSLVAASAGDYVIKLRKKTGLSAIRLSELLFQDLSDAEKGMHMSRRFFINHTGIENQPYLTTRIVIVTDNGKDVERQEIVLTDGGTILNEAIPAGYFDRIHRLLRLSMKTGLSITDLDQVIMNLCGGLLNEDALKAVAVVKLLSEKYELKISEVCTFFSSIKNYGMGETTLKQDMFNMLFNEGGSLTDIRSIEPVGAGIAVLKNRIQASLECSEDEYNVMSEFIPEKWTAKEQTPLRLAAMYRVKKLADLFEIEVSSLVRFFAVLDKNSGLLSGFKFPVPVESDDPVLSCREIITDCGGTVGIGDKLRLVQLAVVMMEWLADSEISVEQLEYICTEHSTGEIEGVMPAVERDSLFRDLENQFRGILVSASTMQSGNTDKNTAESLFMAFSDNASGIVTPHGLMRKTVSGAEILPAYVDAIHDTLFIESDDIKMKDTSVTDEPDPDLIELESIFRKMKNREYLDSESFIADTASNHDLFLNPDKLPEFLEIMQSNENIINLLRLTFKAVSDRLASYAKKKENAVTESAVIAEKLTVCAGRQKTVLMRALESGMDVSYEIVIILLNTLFRTKDEAEEMAVVRFMAPVIEGIENNAAGFDASLVTSFRRMQQFSLLVSKTGLKGRELDVLFTLKKVQASLPEKIKLPAEFQGRIDSMYGSASGDIVIFSGGRYVKYSGADYSVKESGDISGIQGLPASFHTGINAALCDPGNDGSGVKTYLFAGDTYIDEASPSEIKSTKADWGKVRNNIVENNRVDAAYRSGDGKVFLFSGDQYVRYSGNSRDFVDEGYPRNTMTWWNGENQVKLPPDIRAGVDSIFNIGTKIYFFSGDRFIESSDPLNVLNTREHLGVPLNNIVINNRIDCAIVTGGKTFLFSGDQYVRYSGTDYSFIDEGYPKNISGSWSSEQLIDLPEGFNAGVDAAFIGIDGTSYFFRDGEFVSTQSGTIPAPVREKWGKVESNIRLNGKVDAAFTRMGKTYLFSGNQYTRYSGADYSFVDEGYPKKIEGNWNSIEECGSLTGGFCDGITAAMTGLNNRSYFFSGNKYITSDSPSMPAEIKEHWGKVRNNIQSLGTIDAAFIAPDGKTYMFSGDQYYRYSGTDYQNCDEGYPKKIAGNWGLAGAFTQKIEAAFTFNVNGTDRLYLFNGQHYVRYSNSNYSQPDPGYPKTLNDNYFDNPEGGWFDPIYHIGSNHDRISIATIFTDSFNGKERINYFYYDDHGREKLMLYSYNTSHRHWHWDNKSFVIAPFTAVDSGFTGSDGQVYLFSGTKFAIRQGEYTGISAQSDTAGKWGKVLNNIQSLNRIDSSFSGQGGKTYLFCGDQYFRYSSDLNPGNSEFYADEGYPKNITANWQGENTGITLPSVFTESDMALLQAGGTIYLFNGTDFITSESSAPAPINGVWGIVKNNFVELNRVDAGAVINGKTFLFSGDQYTRYSGAYEGYADEGYPKKIANAPASDQLPGMTAFESIGSILNGSDGNIYMFSGSRFISSAAPSEIREIKSKFGIVKSNFASTGVVDAADAKTDGTVYLFSGDQYARYSNGITPYADEGYPKTISSWKSFETGAIPAAAEQGLKAVFTDGNGEIYVFTEQNYFKMSDPSAVSPVNSMWGKVKNNMAETGNVDAAFVAPDGKTYLFSGDQYTCYSKGKSDYTDEGFPKLIAGNWGSGLPADFRAGIDAGFVFDRRTYFFKGDRYIRYSDPACSMIDSGFPLKISGKMSELPEFRLDDIKTFQQFKKLSRSFSSPDAEILKYFTSAVGSNAELRLLSGVTGWKSDEIAFLAESSAVTTDSGAELPDLTDIQTLYEMKSVFDFTEKLGSSPSAVMNGIWKKIHGSGTEINLQEGADTLKGLLKSVTGSAAWKDLNDEIHGKMNLARRDALMGYLIHKMEQESDTSWIDNPRDLYEYLLIDVEMGEESTTSRIQEAIMCMQLFYHRMLMNLEEDHETTRYVKDKLKKWWIWMKNYRVWEANRKVFLYPENYIRPELRDDKSPEFKELEEALLQSDITTDAAEKAYKAYLGKYSEISRLKVAGGYVFQRTTGDGGDTSQTAEALNEKKIIVFGQGAIEPKKYYYMTGDILDPETPLGEQTIDWAPWKETGITINADKVYPVYSFNRIFVFWVENRERDQSTYSNQVGPDDQKIQYDPVIYYSFLNHNSEWTPPQKMFDLGHYVDKLDAAKKQLFIDDRNKKRYSPSTYIPVKDVLNGARLFVTNPITSRYYDAEEFIYISYEARYIVPGASHEFTLEGKLKSDLTFEQGQVDPKLMDKLEKNIQFPFEKFGITPTTFSHWKGFFNDSFSAPWFSFTSNGGSFLVKPDIVPDAPVMMTNDPDKPGLYGVKWNNLPDAGFTDTKNRKHLFYRDSLTPGAPQYYRMVDGDAVTAPVPVSSVWGNRNIFEWYPEGIESVAADGSEIYMSTLGDRYISYTGSQSRIIDQLTVEATKIPPQLSQILPAGATPESWHRVKEDLKDYIDTLENAFVYSVTNTLYLVARPVNSENGQSVREYTIPVVSEFWDEIASIIPPGAAADAMRGFNTVDSAVFDATGGRKRLYVKSGNIVYVKDYIANTDVLHTAEELTHPDLGSVQYDELPGDAVETPWSEASRNLMDFFTRLTGVSLHESTISLVALKGDGTHEFTVPDNEDFFNALADIVNDAVISPVIDEFTALTAADLFTSGDIRRLYLRSEDRIVILDYTTGGWSLREADDLVHPDFNSKVTSLSGLLTGGTAVQWADIAEDFNEYVSTVQRSVVWKGVMYLLTPKPGGGYEYASPTAAQFWSAAGECLSSLSGFTSVDSSAVITEAGIKKLYATSGDKVAVYDFSTKQWILSTINQIWGVAFGRINGLMQTPDGRVYLFSGRDYAEKINGEYTESPVSSRWGAQANVITSMVDSAFMDETGKVYIFTGETFVRYSDDDNKVIDQGYPKNIRTDLGVNMDDVKEEFSADKNNVVITSIGTNTAFVQDVNGHEKMYLFLDISADITRYVWKWRWRWWGGWWWRIHSFFGRRRHRAWWGWWWPEYYLEAHKDTVRKSVYMRFTRQNETPDHDVVYAMDENYPKVITGNWSNLPGDFNRMITATFEDVEGAGQNKKEIFYAVRGLVEKVNGADKITNDYVKYSERENFPKEICEENYEIIRLTSNTSEVLSQRLFMDGIPGLLSLETQKISELPVFFSRDDTEDDLVDEQNENNPLTLKDFRRNDTVLYRDKYLSSGNVPGKGMLDFKSINGQYYWELFFHAPFLIAQAFNNAQKFDEGKEWYEYIFDPTERYDESMAYWKFIPFHEDLDENVSTGLNDRAQYKRYLNDPFDPHAIAALRQVAYRKSIVMNYIDNIIDHGDMLFRQYTRESINEARMFYVLAYDLLGKQPELLGTRRLSESKCYKELYDMQNAVIALIDFENLPENSEIPLAGAGDNVHGSVLDITGYFYIPENREFASYWDTVIDRLTKIRFSLNIDGVKQKLALYEPPIDPMALVRAVGSGAGLAAALADFRVDVPHYRFNFIMGKTRELTGRLTQFGQSLLSALEKKDAEELSLLRNTHEKAIMQLTLDIKNAQLKDSEETLKSLRVNLKSAKTREGHYNMLISQGLSPFEQSQIGLLIGSQVFTMLSQALSTAASMGALVPEAGAFAFHWGGHNIKDSLNGISAAFGAVSSSMSTAGNIISILGGYHRRGQDWSLQKRLAQCDIESIERQIAGAEIKIKVARLEIETAKRNIKNLESVDTFMKGKFTNAQLYRWMAGKLSGLYFQTYRMALDMAKGAQRSFQFELGLKEKDISFITSLYWDSLKKGLLAGETLQVDLDRMETAYIERNRRRFEISKSISLAELDPLALINLREKRACEFTLGEDLFDFDFPGHYCRQIKSVSLTFPAVVGPNGNLNATLTQLSHRTLLDPDKAGAEYLLDPNPKTEQPLSIRGDWRVNQQVALSRGVNDSGLFQLNFQDERYLPFEGTGAVSTWRLELNGIRSAFDVKTLSDVVVRIEYTSLQGGDAFSAAVKKKLKPAPETKMFSLAQDFSAEWNAFMSNPSKGLSVKMTRDMFTDMNGGKIPHLYMLYKVSKEGADIVEIPMNVNGMDVKNGVPADVNLNISSSGSVWKLTPKNNAEDFTPETIEDILLVCTYMRKVEF